MTYYLLPRTSFLIHKYIDCIAEPTAPEIKYSNSLSSYLYYIKEQLDYHERDWDVFKKYTNPYEFIHSIIPGTKQSVATCKPT